MTTAAVTTQTTNNKSCNNDDHDNTSDRKRNDHHRPHLWLSTAHQVSLGPTLLLHNRTSDSDGAASVCLCCRTQTAEVKPWMCPLLLFLIDTAVMAVHVLSIA